MEAPRLAIEAECESGIGEGKGNLSGEGESIPTAPLSLPKTATRLTPFLFPSKILDWWGGRPAAVPLDEKVKAPGYVRVFGRFLMTTAGSGMVSSWGSDSWA